MSNNPLIPQSKLPNLGTTIFTQMSALAQQHQAINLSQGFPDFDGPLFLQERLAYHVAHGANQYAPMTGVLTLREDPTHYRELPAFYQKKRDVLVNALRDSRLEILPCEGTYFLLVDYSAVSTLGDVEFCQWLTKEVGVAAIPLSVFCADPFPHKLIRLCFAKQESTLIAAAERLVSL